MTKSRWSALAMVLSVGTLSHMAAAGCPRPCELTVDQPRWDPPLDCASIQGVAETCDCAMSLLVVNECETPIESVGFTWEGCWEDELPNPCRSVEPQYRASISFPLEGSGEMAQSLTIRVEGVEHQTTLRSEVTSYGNPGCTISGPPGSKGVSSWWLFVAIAGALRWGRCRRSRQFWARLVLSSGLLPLACGRSRPAEPTDDDGQAGEPIPDSPCAFSTCRHGFCVAEGWHYRCECDPGYEGEKCEINHDDCNPNRCKAGGQCQDLERDFSCSCTSEYTGKDCSRLRFEGFHPPINCTDMVSTVSDVDNAGEFVVGGCDPISPFTWTSEDGFRTLPWLGIANGTNEDGEVIVGIFREMLGLPESALYYKMGDDDWMILPSWGRESAAMRVSEDGKVAVGRIRSEDSMSQPARWVVGKDPEIVGLLPGGAEGEALGVNRDGSVVVGWSEVEGGGRHAFRYLAQTGKSLDLGVLEGTSQSRAFAVDVIGSVVVGESYEPGPPVVTRAFRWSEADGMVDLGTPESLPGAGAIDTNGDGSVVAVNGDDDPNRIIFDRAMLWEMRHGLRFITDILTEAQIPHKDWVLRRVVAVSKDGHTIVGRGANPAGHAVPWIARLDGIY